jgi:hypothetical protein
MRIGTVERVPADEARKAARTILARVELGGDPAADKTAMRLSQSRTLRAIAEGFLEYQATRLRPGEPSHKPALSAQPRLLWPVAFRRRC